MPRHTMVFNSFAFFLFFVVMLAVHRLPLSWPVKKLNLLIASSLFYAAWNPKFLALLWISILTDWIVATRMAQTEGQRKRTLLLSVSLIVNLGMLAVFKYGNFLLDNLVLVGNLFHFKVPIEHMSVGLPVGISFYTFETISYTIDVYRRREKPWTRFGDFSLFLTFFPHLVAGPIVRPSDFLPQCEKPQQATRAEFTWGLTLLIFGLFQKMVIADGILAPVVNVVFAANAENSLGSAWIGALAFSTQILFDFGGYSLCAIGVALCFGFKLPDTFNSPYGSIGFSEFWQRWHMSLSSWLRDYLYISLGGNRGSAFNTYRNLMLTMLLGGLWHGASWNFVLWGALHGAYLVGERLTRARWPQVLEPSTAAGRGLGVLVTYGLTVVAWVFFRASDLATSTGLVKAMFGLTRGPGVHFASRWDPMLVLVVTASVLVAHRRFKDVPLGTIVARVPTVIHGAALAMMLLALIVASGGSHVFIYFQF